VIHHGIAIRAGGAAIVSVETDGDNRIVVEILRLPLDLTVVVDEVEELAADPAATFIIDGEQLGAALWQALGRQHRRGWTLYAKRGPERAEITNDLAVWFHEASFRFAADLAEQPAMTKALLAWRRETRDDGPDSELVVALRHALACRRPAVPRVY
jgi:hypothetical protein